MKMPLDSSFLIHRFPLGGYKAGRGFNQGYENENYKF